MTSEFAFPGFIDVHVHFRDPGMPLAETTQTGLDAAARGGFRAVVTMPNTSPAIDSPESVRAHTRVSQSGVSLFTSATITKGRLGHEVANLEGLSEAGAVFFTDDGAYVSSPSVMKEAMVRAANLNRVIAEHAIDPKLAAGGVIRDSALARKLNLPVIPIEAETEAIRRDLALCRETGCRLHVQHVSTAPGVALIRDAQREGLPVTAEATPHHLLLTCDDITADDANFKMAPPLGTAEDRAELRKAVREGAFMFATDHAPHPAQTKSSGFLASANGIVGLETAIAITYAVMVEEEGMDIQDWARAWHELPRDIGPGSFKVAGETRLALGPPRKVDVTRFASLSRNCPYNDLAFTCWPMETK